MNRSFYNRFHPDAYEFLMEALHYSQIKLIRKGHVSAKELLRGFKELAQERFGPLARSVLEHWGLRSTSDIGDLVFCMIEEKLLFKTPKDRKEDFEEVFDFKEVFDRDYKKALKKQLKVGGLL